MMNSTDIGIDLGTASILVYIKGKGVVLKEPSVVAFDRDTNKIRAIGEEARLMLGRTPGNIVAVRPLRQGVISDYTVTEKMLRYFIEKSLGKRYMRKPRIAVCVPSGVTEVENKAVEDATYQAGAKEVAIIEEIPAEEAANIKAITLACIYTDEQLEQRVININKKNPETRIRIKQFYEDSGEMDYEDAMAGFMTAMASDPSVDIVFFNGSTPYADMMNFASKGLLIDLNQFLDTDADIDREDLMGSVLDACTYNDM